MTDFYDWGYGWFSDTIGAILYGIFTALVFSVIIGLLFLLIRFLVIGTKAAQLYIAHNSPQAPPRGGSGAATSAGSRTVPATQTMTPAGNGPAATAVLPERRADEVATTPLPAAEKKASTRITRPKNPPTA